MSQQTTDMGLRYRGNSEKERLERKYRHQEARALGSSELANGMSWTSAPFFGFASTGDEGPTLGAAMAQQDPEGELQEEERLERKKRYQQCHSEPAKGTSWGSGPFIGFTAGQS